MKCNLCLNEKKLIKKSHIFPDFLFSNLYNDKHRLIKFDVIKMFNGKNNVSNPPTSIYEKHILCGNCDNIIISKYENYFANIYHKKEYTIRKDERPNKLDYCIYENLDYNKINIFFLTLLWRSSISSRKEFKDVNLTEKLNEKLRAQILNGIYDGKSVKITGFKLTENSNFNRLVSQFKKFDNHYAIFIKDFILFFHIGNNIIFELTKPQTIQKNGKWILPEIPKYYEQEFILKFINPKKK